MPANKLGTVVLKNQFGETTNNFVAGGSSQLWAKFKVDSTNVNGLGISSLEFQGVSNVYMHTSATPAAGNPNPVAGLIVIQLTKAQLEFLSCEFFLTAANTGSDVNVTTGLTINKAYIITAVGTTTAANWQTLGLPTNIVPAINVVFIAKTASAGTGTGTVQLMAATASGITHAEVLGNPNLTTNVVSGIPYLVLATLGITTSANAQAAITDGSWVHLFLNFKGIAGPVI